METQFTLTGLTLFLLFVGYTLLLIMWDKSCDVEDGEKYVPHDSVDSLVYCALIFDVQNLKGLLKKCNLMHTNSSEAVHCALIFENVTNVSRLGTIFLLKDLTLEDTQELH